MTETSYEVDKDLTEELQRVLDLPDLADAKEHIDIAICFKVREKIGEGEEPTHEPLPPNGDVVVLKKIPPEMQCLMKGEPEYLVIVDKYFWNESEAIQKEISLYRVLIRLKVDTKSNGDFKFSIQPWDITDSIKTLKRYGAYDEKWVLMIDTLVTKRNQTTEMVEAKLARTAQAKAVPAAAKTPAAKPKPKPAAKPAPSRSKLDMPSDEEPPEEEEEVPRVRMAQIPAKAKASPVKSEKNGERDEPLRPARKPPADPEPDEAAPEPDDQ